MATSFYKERVRVNACKALVGATVAAGVLTSVILPNPCLAIAQTDPSQPSPSIVAGVALRGTVIDSSGGLAVDATVRLVKVDGSMPLEIKTDTAGAYVFSALQEGKYMLSAEKSGWHSRAISVAVESGGDPQKVQLVLEESKVVTGASGAQKDPALDAMEFADKPNFTVAGVTDWTAVGGHGSDAILRTSESLARETIALKPEGSDEGTPISIENARQAVETERKLRAVFAASPASLEANRQLGEFYFHGRKFQECIPLLQAAYHIDPANHDDEWSLAVALKEVGDYSQSQKHVQNLLHSNDTAPLHRLAGEVDEKLGDPLAAVHEFEQASRIDPSEENYFEWGSELLLHRAVWQAQQIFAKGVEAYPHSARMLTASGSALFAGARYDEAAARLCEASDLNPSDEEPYIFMGKVELAAPSALSCVEQRLHRYVQQRPDVALANYFYAMAIWKRQQVPPDAKDLYEVEALLTRAVTIDAKCSDGFLQLGILASTQRRFEKAAQFYAKAIQANPQSGDAHYRLGVAYDRLGEPAKAKEEFRLHDEIEKSQAAAIEEQRREVKQFLVVLDSQGKSAPMR